MESSPEKIENIAMSLSMFSHHGVRRIKGTGRKRKGVDEYAAENRADFTPRSIVRDGQSVRVLVCRFCCQSIGARSDRIKEHLASKRHIKLKIEALKSMDQEDLNACLPRETLQNMCQVQEPVHMSDVEEYQQRKSSPEVDRQHETTTPQSMIRQILDSPTSQSFNGGIAGVGLEHGFRSENCFSGYVSPAPRRGPQSIFRVKWEKFDSNIISMFSKFHNQENFVDVTLWCEGKTIKCHRLVLAASSTYFEKLLTEDTNPHPIIFFTDKRFWEIQALVEFIYRGEVRIQEERLSNFLSAAQSLKIKGLCSLVSKMETTEDGTNIQNIEDKEMLSRVTGIAFNTKDDKKPNSYDVKNNGSGHSTLYTMFDAVPDLASKNTNYDPGWQTCISANILPEDNVSQNKIVRTVPLNSLTPLAIPSSMPTRLLPQPGSERVGEGISSCGMHPSTIRKRNKSALSRLSVTASTVPSIFISAMDSIIEKNYATPEDAMAKHERSNAVLESGMQQDLLQLHDHDCNVHGNDDCGCNFVCKYDLASYDGASASSLSLGINSYLPSAVGNQKTNPIKEIFGSESSIRRTILTSEGKLDDGDEQPRKKKIINNRNLSYLNV